MAQRLKLPENFRVRTFWSSHSPNGLGKYLPAPDDVQVISQTRLTDSVAGPLAHFPSLSEATVVSPEVPDLAPEVNDEKEKAEPSKRKRRKIAPTTLTRRWQEVWACRFTWAEGEFDDAGNLIGVVCKSCTRVSGRKKILVLKGDNLEKHEGKRTCKFDGEPEAHLKAGDTYTKRDCKHIKFNKLWAGRRLAGTVADQILAGWEAKASRKGVQFSTLFQVLSCGRPMCDYERQEHLLRHLKVKHVPKKHWSETSGWEMSEHLHGCVMAALKLVVQSARFVSISADEVTAVDNTSWIGVHVYAVQSWERVPHLLHLSCVSDCGTADHLTDVIMHSLLGEGGLSREQIAGKVVSFGADGVSTFQGAKTDISTQIREKWAPFCLGASCASHRINLVVETLSNYPMVSRLEALCQSLYAYFCRSHKRHTELQKLADLMETKGNKMLRNVETRWISMRSPAERIMSEFRTLLVKMAIDMSAVGGGRRNTAAATNFDYLSDIEVLLSLACFIPMLNVVHCRIKLSQARDIFICDFLQAVKLCQSDLARMFVDDSTAFQTPEFQRYQELISLSSAEVPMIWSEMPGHSGALYLLYKFKETSVFSRCHCKVTGDHSFVTEEEFLKTQGNIQRQFSEIAHSLSNELDKRFPQQELLDAFGVIYPQYWKQPGADESFTHHLAVLKKFYSHARVLKACQPLQEGGSSYTAPELLSGSNLDNQHGLFKVTMKANCDAACTSTSKVNPVILLWRSLSQSRHLQKLISEYFKLAEIGCCLVLGSVEDERCFSTLKFLKSCQRNRLGKHLPLVVRMFGQNYYSLENFPYQEAIESWKNAVKVGRHGDV